MMRRGTNSSSLLVSRGPATLCSTSEVSMAIETASFTFGSRPLPSPSGDRLQTTEVNSPTVDRTARFPLFGYRQRPRLLSLVALLFLIPFACQAGNMTWMIYDSCPGREPIRFRFFDNENYLVWPKADQFWYTKRYGEGYTQQLECTKGSKICYGAWQPGAAKYWGAGETGSEACTDCCARCDGDTYVKRLTCG